MALATWMGFVASVRGNGNGAGVVYLYEILEINSISQDYAHSR